MNLHKLTIKKIYLYYFINIFGERFVVLVKFTLIYRISCVLYEIKYEQSLVL